MTRSFRRAAAAATVIAAVGIVAAAGCSDLGVYAGTWSGTVVETPAVRVGMVAGTSARLVIERADRNSIAASLSLGAESMALRTLAPAASDALGDLALPDAPLRSYVMVAPLVSGDALAVVTLYPDDRVDLRLLRGEALYAVFHLRRDGR